MSSTCVGCDSVGLLKDVVSVILCVNYLCCSLPSGVSYVCVVKVTVLVGVTVYGISLSMQVCCEAVILHMYMLYLEFLK